MPGAVLGFLAGVGVALVAVAAVVVRYLTRYAGRRS